MSIIRAIMVHATVILLFLSAVAAMAQPITPPGKPEFGPGGSDYLHASATMNGPYWAEGYEDDNNYRYFTFEPAEPKPKEVPVVLFLHGWLAYDTEEYSDWIAHIVRKGYTVVWVQYDKGFTMPWNFAKRTLITWKDALNRLKRDPWNVHVDPETNYRGKIKTSYIGHSVGGYLSAILAAKTTRWWVRVPKPYLVVAIEPGGKGYIFDEGLNAMDPGTKILLVAGDEDKTVCLNTALYIWNETSSIFEENKQFLLIRSDRRGQPEQIANHSFPNNSGFADTAAVDARDFYVTFKLSVAALNCAMKGMDCEYAFGNGSDEQIDMGYWSDGVAVLPMLWTPDPNLLEASCQDR
jgi:pimeloyl-ACP methyl ester carboxylesterase